MLCACVFAMVSATCTDLTGQLNDFNWNNNKMIKFAVRLFCKIVAYLLPFVQICDSQIDVFRLVFFFWNHFFLSSCCGHLSASFQTNYLRRCAFILRLRRISIEEFDVTVFCYQPQSEYKSSIEIKKIHSSKMLDIVQYALCVRFPPFFICMPVLFALARLH